MANSVIARSLKDAVLTIKDGTGTPKTVAVIIGTGNITWSVNTPKEYVLDRGLLASGTVRDADEVPMDVNLVCRYVDVNSDQGSTPAELVTPYEAIYRKGAAVTASWTSVGADPCEPYAVDLQLVHTPVCTGGTAKTVETIVFDEFRAEKCDFDPSAGTFTFSGKCKAVHPTVTRTQTP